MFTECKHNYEYFLYYSYFTSNICYFDTIYAILYSQKDILVTFDISNDLENIWKMSFK